MIKTRHSALIFPSVSAVDKTCSISIKMMSHVHASAIYIVSIQHQVFQASQLDMNKYDNIIIRNGVNLKVYITQVNE